MRPRIEGKEERRVLELINSSHPSLSPTQLIEHLINTYYESIYPRGERSDNGKIEEDKTHTI